jgi:hypothetical protein
MSLKYEPTSDPLRGGTMAEGLGLTASWRTIEVLRRGVGFLTLPQSIRPRTGFGEGFRVWRVALSFLTPHTVLRGR